MLQPMREEWSMYFATTGEEALAILEQRPMDVVVSDMRMPGMDGSQLLAEVARLYPDMVRIVLSGHSEREAVLRCVGPSHQYLAKPCDADTLRRTISRACSLRELLSSKELQPKLAEIRSLPKAPAIYTELVSALRDDNVPLKRIVSLVERDPALAAKILQLANSAYFGLPREIVSISSAVNFLGLRNLTSAILTAGVFAEIMDAEQLADAFGDEDPWRHATGVGGLAKRIAETLTTDQTMQEEAMTAGLLHDCGQLVLAASYGRRYREVLQNSKSESVTLVNLEREAFGADHAKVGAYLLGIWGLPDSIVEVVVFHHEPILDTDRGATALTAVHVADAMINGSGSFENGIDGLDLGYMADLGLDDRIDEWLELAEEM